MKVGRFFVVHESVVPDGVKKVCAARNLLMSGKAKTVAEATESAGISRSLYYKYRNSVTEYTHSLNDSIINLQAVLENRAGVLSAFLNMVAKAGGNLITVNQGIPIRGAAAVTLSVNISQLKVSRESLMKRLLSLSGVNEVSVSFE